MFRKNKTWAQKKKRASSHQMGKRWTKPTSTRQPVSSLMHHEMLRRTNKLYKRYEDQEILGSFLIVGPLFYFALIIIFVALRLLGNKFLAEEVERSLSLTTLGILRLPKQPPNHSFFDLLKRYFTDNPLVTIVAVLELVAGLTLASYADKRKQTIKDNTDLDELERKYAELKKKGRVTND